VLPGRKYTPEDILTITWRRKWWIVVVTVLMTGLAVSASMRLQDRFRSETLILVIPQRVPESYVRSTVTMRIEDRLRSIQQEILSRSRLERIITDFDLYADERRLQPMEQVVADMRANVEVDTVRDDAFRVSFVAPSPRTAMIVADRLATMFIEENVRDRGVQADGTNQFLESQLEDARDRLLGHERRLEEFRRRYSGELPSQLSGNLQVLQATQRQIQDLSESINRDRDRRLIHEKSMADVLSSDPSASPLDGAPPAGAAGATGRALNELERARGEMRELQLRLRPEHPDVVAKRRSIAELERKVQQEATASAGIDPTTSKPVTGADLIRRARAQQYQTEMDKLDQQIASKEGEVSRLRQSMVEYQRRVEAVPGHESELTELMRDYETIQKFYAELLSKKENSRISANLERQQVSEQFKILDPARLPEEPFSPNRPRIAMIAAVLGLVLGLGIVGFLEYRDTSLRTEDEIVRALSLPVIAGIPMMRAVADVRRRRRRLVLTLATSTLLVAGVVTAVLWNLDLLKGIS
jgi:polysaccharide chain length determinant protein (PEP-CTERM system associated)